MLSVTFIDPVQWQSLLHMSQLPLLSIRGVVFLAVELHICVGGLLLIIKLIDMPLTKVVEKFHVYELAFFDPPFPPSKVPRRVVVQMK